MGRIGKKVLSWTLCLMMAVGMLPGMTRKAEATVAVIEISSYQDLKNFAAKVNGGETSLNAKLTANIVCKNDSADTEYANDWTPIGTNTTPYVGIFDGNGKKIIGLTIDSSSIFVGLFGYVGSDGTIRNVCLEGGSINGKLYVGGVVGENHGTVENCDNTGIVSAKGIIVGGVVGKSDKGTVKNCHNTGAVIGGDNFVGGVVGSNTGGTVENCHNAGHVEGKLYVGGVVGNDEEGSVENCNNSGDVTGKGNFVGGVVGYYKGDSEKKSKILDCHNTGSVTGNNNTVGGIVGQQESGIVKNCDNTGKVVGNGNYVGGVVGYSNGGTVENCNNSGDIVGNLYAGGVTGDNSNYGTVSNCYNTGEVTGKNNFAGGVAGANDDGCNLSNCYNTGAVIGKNNFVGGVVGINNGILTYSYNSGAVEGINAVGGVVGDQRSGKVSKCYNTGSVTGDDDVVGGVVGGLRSGEVSNCYNTGAVTGKRNLGGVVGDLNGTVTNCYNAGDVSGNDVVGGVAGVISSGGKITNCYYDLDACSAEREYGSYEGGIIISVSGFNTSLMTSDSLAVLAAFSEGVWYFNKNDSVTQTMFYPHLKGFRYDTTNNIEDWPARRTKMTVTASEASGTYDGVVLTTQDEGYTNTALFTGDSIVSVTFEDKVSLGKGFRTPIDCKIVDYLGQDVTSKYQITYVAATMDFIPKEITITADNAAKEYDGTALTKNSYTNSKLADGDSITSVAINGSRIMAGESANVPSAAVIMNASNEDVTAFYHINYKNGTLDVTQKALTIIADGDTKEYDGTALTYNSFTFKGLVSGDAIESVTFSGTQTMVGSTNNVPSAAVIKNAAGQDVTTSYDITYVNGTLEVTQKAVTITADSASKDYDGTALTKDSVTAEGLAIGDTIESVTITGSQNTIGKSNNVPSAAVIKNAAGQDVTTSYDITYVNGTLEVTQKAVTITADSASKDYDGTALTKDSVTAEGLATGDKIESIFVTGSQTVVGKSDNTPSEAKIVNASGEDVTKCYEITYAKGTLEVTKKALTITADSDTKVYDKTALTKDSYTSSGLADGDSIKSIAITGSQTMKGSSDNVPSKAVIVNSKGEDVTACYAITYKNGTLTVTAPQAPALPDDQKPAPKNDLKEDGKEQVLVLDPAKLPEGYTIEYSTDGGKTWSAVPTGTRSGEYTIEVLYKADENHTDFFGDTLNVIIQGVYNQTDSDGDWTKGSGKTYTFRIKKAFNDETTYDNLTGVFVDGKKAEPGKDYTPAKGSAIITFAADYLETLSVGEHMIRVVFKDGEVTVPLKILAAIATPTPAVDATPVTGDTANPFLWAALVLLSMAGVALMIEKKRRKA